MIRAMLVDNDLGSRSRLRSLVQDEPDFRIVGECSTAKDALEAIRSRWPDLLILDAEVIDCSQLELKASLRGKRRPKILFVTAHQQYAARAFDCDAVDFVLKPYSSKRLSLALERVRRALQREPTQRTAADMSGPASALQPSPQRVVFKSGTRRIIVNLRELEKIEAQRDYALLHIGNDRHLIRATMENLEAELPSRMFCRIHRSTIINIDYLSEIRTDSGGRAVAVMRNSAPLSIGRKYSKKLLASLRSDETPERAGLALTSGSIYAPQEL